MRKNYSTLCFWTHAHAHAQVHENTMTLWTSKPLISLWTLLSYLFFWFPSNTPWPPYLIWAIIFTPFFTKAIFFNFLEPNQKNYIQVTSPVYTVQRTRIQIKAHLLRLSHQCWLPSYVWELLLFFWCSQLLLCWWFCVQESPSRNNIPLRSIARWTICNRCWLGDCLRLICFVFVMFLW